MNIHAIDENEFGSLKKIYDEYCYSVGKRFMTDEDYRSLKYDISSGSVVFYVMKESEDVIGFMSVAAGGCGADGMKVCDMYVVAQFRNKGFAREMVKQVSDLLCSRGVAILWLECEPFYVRKFKSLGFGTEMSREGRNVILCAELIKGRMNSVSDMPDMKIPKSPSTATGGFTYVPAVGRKAEATKPMPEPPPEDVVRDDGDSMAESCQNEDMDDEGDYEDNPWTDSSMSGGGAWDEVHSGNGGSYRPASGYSGSSSTGSKPASSRKNAVAVFLIAVATGLFFLSVILNGGSKRSSVGEFPDISDFNIPVAGASEPEKLPWEYIDKEHEPVPDIDEANSRSSAGYDVSDQDDQNKPGADDMDIFAQVRGMSFDALNTTIYTQFFGFTVLDMRHIVNIPEKIVEAGAEVMLAMDIRFDGGEQAIQLPMVAFLLFTATESGYTPVPYMEMAGQPEDFFLLEAGSQLNVTFYYAMDRDFTEGILQYVQYGEEGEVTGVFSANTDRMNFIDSNEILEPVLIEKNQYDDVDDYDSYYGAEDETEEVSVSISYVERDISSHEGIALREGEMLIHLKATVSNLSDKNLEIVEDSIVFLHTAFASNLIPLDGVGVDSNGVRSMDLYFAVPESTTGGTLHFEVTPDGKKTWTVIEEYVDMGVIQ